MLKGPRNAGGMRVRAVCLAAVVSLGLPTPTGAQRPALPANATYGAERPAVPADTASVSATEREGHVSVAATAILACGSQPPVTASVSGGRLVVSITPRVAGTDGDPRCARELSAWVDLGARHLPRRAMVVLRVAGHDVARTRMAHEDVVRAPPFVLPRR